MKHAKNAWQNKKLDNWKPNASSKYKTLKKLLSHVNLGFINALADWGRSRFTSKYIIAIFWVSVSREQTFKCLFSTFTSFVGKIRSSTPSKIVQLDKPAEFQSFSLLPVEARPSEIHLQRERFFLAERRRHVAGSLKPSGPGKTFKPSKSPIAEQFEESAKKINQKFSGCFLKTSKCQIKTTSQHLRPPSWEVPRAMADLMSAAKPPSWR